MDWALIADAAGNAVVAFADIRGGGSDIHAYRIAPDGAFLWGADGIDITDDTDDKGPPSLVETNDGDIVVAWFASPAAGSPAIKVQRLSPDGTIHYAAGGIPVTEAADTFPAGAVMVPCGPDGFLMGYVPVYSYMANRQIKAQRFDADGDPVWADYLMVMDDGTVPMGHYFQMIPDGLDGAWFGWTVATGLDFTVRAQHVDADGGEGYAHNGLRVSTEATYSQIYPELARDAASGELTVLYMQQNGTQDQKGVFAQRLGAAGGRLWGDTGREILPVDTTIEGFARVVDTGDGAIGVCFQAPYNSYGQERIIGFRLDTEGLTVWDPPFADVSSTPSDKDDLLATIGGDGTVRAVWVDGRDGTPDVYGQNLNGDGSLGPLVVATPEGPAAPLHLAQNHPNPFNPATRIAFALLRREQVDLRIFDARGRLVRLLFAGEAGPGPRTVTWDGRDDTGAEVPSGVYHYRLDTRTDHRMRSMVLIR
jgi:hypothetical protein